MTPDQLTRRFPFRVRPQHRETFDSYARRVLEANYGAKEGYPRALVGLAKTHGVELTWPEILSAKTGRSVDQLLTSPTVVPAHGADGDCAVCRAALPPRWRCVMCAAGEYVEQWPHLDEVVCERHARWVGPNTTPATQTPVPDSTVAAHRSYRRLIHQERTTAVTVMALTALIICEFAVSPAVAFERSVSVFVWLTQPATLRSVFAPSQAEAETFQLLTQALTVTIGRHSPKIVRAMWLHVLPAFLALDGSPDADGGSFPYDPHSFQIPTYAASWWPRRAQVPTDMDAFVACTGDARLSALSHPFVQFGWNALDSDLHLERLICRNGNEHHVVQRGSALMRVTVKACAECSRHGVIVGRNDLKSVAPAIAQTLHPTLNDGITAEGIRAASNQKLWWTCSRGHDYQATPANRKCVGSGCPVCLNRVIRTGTNDLATTHPELAAQWHPGALAFLSPFRVGAGDSRATFWLCPEHHTYRAPVNERVQGRGCPECRAAEAPLKRHPLSESHPDLARQWSPELNSGKHAGQVSAGSRTSVTWRCDKGHVYKMRVERRSSGGQCPFCVGLRTVVGTNDLATTHPALAVEWHATANTDAVTAARSGSNKLRHWKCVQGHHTIQSTAHRILSQGCTQCPQHSRALTRAEGVPGQRTVGPIRSPAPEA